jgi:hypothetical protein
MRDLYEQTLKRETDAGGNYGKALSAPNLRNP